MSLVLFCFVFFLVFWVCCFCLIGEISRTAGERAREAAGVCVSHAVRVLRKKVRLRRYLPQNGVAAELHNIPRLRELQEFVDFNIYI